MKHWNCCKTVQNLLIAHVTTALYSRSFRDGLLRLSHSQSESGRHRVKYAPTYKTPRQKNSGLITKSTLQLGQASIRTFVLPSSFANNTPLVDNISSSNCGKWKMMKSQPRRSRRDRHVRQRSGGRRGSHSAHTEECTQRSRTAYDRRPSRHGYEPREPLAKLAPHLHSTVHQRTSNSITATRLAGINQSKTSRESQDYLTNITSNSK